MDAANGDDRQLHVAADAGQFVQAQGRRGVGFAGGGEVADDSASTRAP